MIEPLHAPAVPGLYPAYTGRAPWYEVWFGKADLAPGLAFWFRYTLLDGTRREAAAWAILFRDGMVHTGRDVSPLARVHLGNPRTPGVVFDLDGRRLAQGRATGAAGDLTWDLSFEDRGRRHEISGPLYRKLGLSRSVYTSCYQDLRFRGTVTVRGESLPVEGAPGMIGHIDGSRQALGWAWVHCGTWDRPVDAVFEGLSARVAPRGIVSPPLTSMVLHVGERTWSSSTPADLVLTRSMIDQVSWRFAGRAGTALLTGSASFAGSVALVEYADTDGSRLWCRNGKLSNLRVRLRDPLHGVDHALVSTGRAAFEIVDRTPPDRPVDL
ncbi:MAG: hypothetical protein FJ098_12210 [Deltaproteobacteria bacterium]|nr:hypothetical protein [Deltaproteobacteria bacterium]